VNYYKSTIRKKNTNIKLDVWDTAGQEKYRSLTLHYLRGSDGFIIVFDLTSISSFQNLNYWMKFIKNHSSVVPKILVGNKLDLFENRAVPKNDIENFCLDNDLFYLESSAKSNINIDQIFNYLVEECYQKSEKSREIPKEKISNKDETEKKSIKNQNRNVSCCKIN